MKLGSLKSGGRDGALVVVSRDLTRQVDAMGVARTLQIAIENWPAVVDDLQKLADDLEAGKGKSAPFEADAMHAPLPRAYQWADGSSYVNFAELMSRARGAQVPVTFWSDPLMYQGGSDQFLGPTDDILAESQDWGVDFEAEIAVITDDVPLSTTAEAAKGHIRLLMLANDISLRELVAGEASKGFGFFQSKPATAFSPVAVTPDELGPAWDGQKLYLPLLSTFNGKLFGRPEAGVDMAFDFPTLIAHATKTRSLGAGTVIGSGMVSNRQEIGASSHISGGGVGYSCLAELRTIETLTQGTPKTAFMKFGDHIRIEMLDRGGASIFGAIDQRLRQFVPEI